MRKLALYTALLFAVKLAAQDPHWSQPEHCLITQNPAFAGVLRKYNVSLDYRTQWNAVNVSYNTALAAGDFRLKQSDASKACFSLGGIFYSDVAGDGSYRSNSGGILFSCQVQSTDHIRIGSGIGVSFMQQSLNFDKFKWGDQFNGANYDPNIISGEASGIAKHNSGDLHAGVSVLYTKAASTATSADDTKLLFGYSLYHITKENTGIYGPSNLPWRHNFFMTGNIGLKNNTMSLEPIAFWYNEGKQNEITAGMLMRFVVSEQSKITGFKQGNSFSAGALYRYNDAIIPTIKFETGRYVFGLSYDLNVSSLTPASHLRGGLEVSFTLKALSDYLYEQKTQPEKQPSN